MASLSHGHHLPQPLAVQVGIAAPADSLLVRPARCAHPSRQLDRVAARHCRQRRLQGIRVGHPRRLHCRHLRLQAGEFLVYELDALQLRLGVIGKAIEVVAFVVDGDVHLGSFIKKPHPLVRGGVGRFSPKALTFRLGLSSFGGD